MVRFTGNAEREILVGSQLTDSQPVSDVASQENESKIYILNKGSRQFQSKDAVAVLVMTCWNQEKEQLKTVVRSKFKTDAFNYRKMKSVAHPWSTRHTLHLTNDSASFYITGETADKYAALCVSVIKVKKSQFVF